MCFSISFRLLFFFFFFFGAIWGCIEVSELCGISDVLIGVWGTKILWVQNELTLWSMGLYCSIGVGGYWKRESLGRRAWGC